LTSLYRALKHKCERKREEYEEKEFACLPVFAGQIKVEESEIEVEWD
jgi:hypothetical protein